MDEQSGGGRQAASGGAKPKGPAHRLRYYSTFSPPRHYELPSLSKQFFVNPLVPLSQPLSSIAHLPCSTVRVHRDFGRHLSFVNETAAVFLTPISRPTQIPPS